MSGLLFSTLRRLARSPGYAATVTALLAVALAVAGGAFSVYYGLLHKPLPYPQPTRLMTLDVEIDGSRFGVSEPLVDMVRGQVRAFDAVGAWRSDAMAWQSGDTATELRVAKMEPQVLEMLGAHAQAGRLFGEADAVPGAVRGVVLSWAFWQQQFAGAPEAIGQRIELDGQSFEVLGVMPRDFAFPARTVQAWMPLGFSAEEKGMANVGNFSGLQAMARLAPQADMQEVQPALIDAIREPFSRVPPSMKMSFSANPLRDVWTQGQAQPAGLMLLAALLVFGVTCVNLCNLAISRALSLRQDVAIQAALGADGGRRIVQSGGEAFVLCGIAATLALMGVPAVLALLRALDRLPADIPLSIGVDAATVGVVLALAWMCAVAVALCMLSLWRTSALRMAHSGGQRQTGSANVGRVRLGLVVAQVAVSMALLVGIGLLLRSSQALLNEDVGFERRNLLVADLGELTGGEGDASLQATRLAQIVERSRALPGVVAVGVGSLVPFDEGMRIGTYFVDGVRNAQANSAAFYYAVDADYFQAMGMTLRRGRNFSAEEVRSGAPVAIVDEAFVARHFSGRDPLGQRLRFEAEPQDAEPELTIIGVVPEVKQRSLDGAAEHPGVYQPAATPEGGKLVLRSVGDPAALVEPLRAVVREVAPAWESGTIIAMESRITATLADRARLDRLLQLLGLAALGLSAFGLYAVLAYNVRQRTRELGVRMALGAAPSRIGRSVLTQAATLAVVGCLLGVPLSWSAARLLQARLYGVGAFDAPALLAAAALLLLAAVLAAWLPARRAVRIAPMQALRQE